MYAVRFPLIRRRSLHQHLEISNNGSHLVDVIPRNIGGPGFTKQINAGLIISSAFFKVLTIMEKYYEEIPGEIREAVLKTVREKFWAGETGKQNFPDQLLKKIVASFI